MKPSELELVRLRRAVARLRDQVALAKADVEFKRRGGEVIYASDYLELHVYLFRTVPFHAVDVGFHPTRPDLARHQQLLALAYLFESASLGGAVYLLPPHASELAAVLRNAGRRFAGQAQLRAEAQALVESLSPKEQELLAALGEGKSLDLVALRGLTSLVRRRFGEICRRASEHVASTVALARLRELVKRKRLSSAVDEMIGGVALDPRMISGPESVAVYEAMNPAPDADRQLSKLLDAEAILWLREYNRRLPPTKKLVLVTGDLGLHVAAAALAKQPWFGWSEVAGHVRSSESLLLHLTLQGTDDFGTRLQWTNQTLDVLDAIARGIPEPTTPLQPDIARSGRDLFERAGSLWEEHLNVRLSTAAPKEAWLRKGFRAGPGPAGWERESITAEPRNALGLLRDFWTFVLSEEYQREAAKHDAALLQELVGQALRILILRVIGPDYSEPVLEVFTKHLSTRGLERVLREDAVTMLSGLRFRRQEYQRAMAKIIGARGDRRRLVSDLRTLLLDTGRYLAAASTNDPEGELFVAFVISLFGLWQAAHFLCLRSSREPYPLRAEALYYGAMTARNVALAEGTADLGWLAKSYELIEDAIAQRRIHEPPESADDARFLAERAWIILQFGDQLRQDPATVVSAPALQASKIVDAVRDLRAALALAQEGWLRVSILLPLCICCSYLKNDGLRTAEEYLAELKAELSRDQQGPKIFPPGYYQARFVEMIVASRRAVEQKDAGAARSAVGELEKLLEDARLSPYERRMVERSIKSIARHFSTP